MSTGLYNYGINIFKPKNAHRYPPVSTFCQKPPKAEVLARGKKDRIAAETSSD
jgi:hypothetical protein